MHDLNVLDLAGPSFRLWVAGSVVVPPWDEAKRAAADALTQAAGVLGLVAHRAPVAGEVVSSRRRWTQRRVTLDEVATALSANPVASLESIALVLYHDGTSPWTDDVRAQAVAKLRVALHKLSRQGLAVKRSNGAWTRVS